MGNFYKKKRGNVAETLIIGKAKNKFYVITPMGTTEVSTDSTYEEFYNEVMEMVNTGILKFNINKEIRSVTIISPNQHFNINIMGEADFTRWQIMMRQSQMR